jgi:20S proteasome subunit alpha 3
MTFTDCGIVEFATVGKTKDGRIYHHLWGADEITTLLKEHDLAKDETGADGDRIVS